MAVTCTNVDRYRTECAKKKTDTYDTLAFANIFVVKLLYALYVDRGLP